MALDLAIAFSDFVARFLSFRIYVRRQRREYILCLRVAGGRSGSRSPADGQRPGRWAVAGPVVGVRVWSPVARPVSGERAGDRWPFRWPESCGRWARGCWRVTRPGRLLARLRVTWSLCPVSRSMTGRRLEALRVMASNLETTASHLIARPSGQKSPCQPTRWPL